MTAHGEFRTLGSSDPHCEPTGLSDERWDALLRRCDDARSEDMKYSVGAAEDWDEIIRCVEACKYVDRMRRVGASSEEPKGRRRRR